MKPTLLTTGLLVSLCALAAAGCNNETIKPDATATKVKVSYDQTQCADRWGQAKGTQQLVAVAQAYLAQQGVTLYQPQATVKDAGAFCNACTCPTGVVLEGQVLPADLPLVLALGFKQ